MQQHEGRLDGARLRVAIVVARFNETIGRALLDGALDRLRRLGIADEDIAVAWVPGALEIPLVAQRFAASGDVDAVVCLGAVIRGETPHFDVVTSESASGMSRVALETGIPVTNGVLTTDDAEQARERAGGKVGNKGADAAEAAVEMANLLAALPKPSL